MGELDGLTAIVTGAARNIGRAIGQVLEDQLPGRQHAKSPVTDQSDVELAAADELLDDSVGLDLFVDELDPLAQLVVVFDERRLGDTERRLLHE